jgi:hypothetical protein
MEFMHWDKNKSVWLEFFLYFFKINMNWAPVAHTCNPSFSGSRNQEDRGSKPARANSSRDPVSKNPLHTHIKNKK